MHSRESPKTDGACSFKQRRKLRTYAKQSHLPLVAFLERKSCFAVVGLGEVMLYADTEWNAEGLLIIGRKFLKIDIFPLANVFFKKPPSR